MKRLIEFAGETKSDALLRGFGTTVNRKNVNLRMALSGFDRKKKGFLNYDQFSQALSEMRIGLSEKDIHQLAEFSKTDDDLININAFKQKVDNLLKVKPVFAANLSSHINELKKSFAKIFASTPASNTAKKN